MKQVLESNWILRLPECPFYALAGKQNIHSRRQGEMNTAPFHASETTPMVSEHAKHHRNENSIRRGL